MEPPSQTAAHNATPRGCIYTVHSNTLRFIIFRRSFRLPLGNFQWKFGENPPNLCVDRHWIVEYVLYCNTNTNSLRRQCRSLPVKILIFPIFSWIQTFEREGCVFSVWNILFVMWLGVCFVFRKTSLRKNNLKHFVLFSDVLGGKFYFSGKLGKFGKFVTREKWMYWKIWTNKIII